MLLSSIPRLFRFTELTDDSASTTARPNTTRLKTWLSAVSAQVSNYLNRDVELKTYTEYFDYDPTKMEYGLQGIPVQFILSLYQDSTGQYTGSESLLDDSWYTLGRLGRSFSLLYPLVSIYPWRRRTLRIMYLGGLASDPVRSTFIITTPVAPFSLGNFVTGQLSGAVGICRQVNPTEFIVENLSGTFKIGETVVGSSTEFSNPITDVSATITGITSQSLAESYPEIVTATEMQIRYMKTHRDDFENIETMKDGTRRRTPGQRRGSVDPYAELQPDVKALLDEHVRLWIGD